MNELVTKSVKVSRDQVAWVMARSTSFSRYVRSLIDQQIGAAEARTLAAAGQYDHGNTKQKPPQKVTAWEFPKG